MSPEPAFYRLPQELLSIVADEYRWITESHKALRALRLAHPRFAYLGELLHPLFCRVVFSASPLSLERISNTRMDRIAPYIQAASFASSLYSIYVTREQFFASARQQAERISLPRAEEAFPDWRAGISEREIRDAYKIYEKLHLEFVESIESGRAVSILATALRSCEKARTVEITYGDSERHRGRVGYSLEEMVGRVGNALEEMVLLEQLTMNNSLLAPQWGDALVELAVKVLAKSKIKPTELNFQCRTNGLQPWGAVPEWKEVDFSKIETLTFNPGIDGDYSVVRHVSEETRMCCVAQGCSGLIARAAQSVETLCLGSDIMPWGVHFAKLETLNLRRIEMCCTGFDPRPFSAWVSRCHGLEELEMERAKVKGRKMSWRILFDAIRSMSKDIVFELNDIAFDYGEAKIWMVCDTSIQVDYSFDPMQDVVREEEDEAGNEDSDGEADDDIVLALEAYLSSSAEWSSSLETWFRGE